MNCAQSKFLGVCQIIQVSFMLDIDSIVYYSNPLMVPVHLFLVKYSYTIPHKEDGLKCCDEVDPIAKVSCHCEAFIIQNLFTPSP